MECGSLPEDLREVLGGDGCDRGGVEVLLEPVAESARSGKRLLHRDLLVEDDADQEGNVTRCEELLSGFVLGERESCRL